MTEENEFEGKLGDAVKCCARGEIAVCDFLSPRGEAAARRLLKSKPCGYIYEFFGGYPDAERKLLFLLPDYIDEWQDELASDFITAVRISGSGYEELSHRSYMGALLSLGLDRQAVGDIITNGAHEAVVWLKHPVARFLLSDEQPLKKVARDTVRVTPYDGDGSELVREFESVSGTVASARFDCVAAELANLSRERAKQTIISGEAELNYETADPSDEVSEGDVISVRGRGKFRIVSIGEKTRRDRFRLSALKYK